MRPFRSILIAAVLLQGCSSQVYNNETYLNTHNITGKKVAILPVEVEFTGKLPQGYSTQKKMSVEETESELIQNLIYSEYLYSAKRNSHKQKAVQLLSPEQVNSRLENKGITIRQSWAMSPDSLAKISGADLVLKVHVKKDRIMSESTSLGIGVATSVLGSILSGGNNPVSINSGAKTYTINLDATLSDIDGNVISRLSHEGSASWNHSPESVIKETNKKIIRKGAVYIKK